MAAKDAVQKDKESHKEQIYYSDTYKDEMYEYRHVILPKEIAKKIPKGRLLTEQEWRQFGVQQSLGWVHFMIHEPEPHILLFRRSLKVSQQVQQQRAAAAIQAQQQQYNVLHMK
jgi:cyclin-dependent kinase regulatory subunit CKS1